MTYKIFLMLSMGQNIFAAIKTFIARNMSLFWPLLNIKHSFLKSRKMESRRLSFTVMSACVQCTFVCLKTHLTSLPQKHIPFQNLLPPSKTKSIRPYLTQFKLPHSLSDCLSLLDNTSTTCSLSHFCTHYQAINLT